MRVIYIDSKMPTISECETLGQELGLPRRVVQVWFQNARAKEKKGIDFGRRIPRSCTSSPLASSGDQCSLCGTVYTAQHTVQDHLYTKGHLGNVKAAVMQQNFYACSPSSKNNSTSSRFMFQDNSGLCNFFIQFNVLNSSNDL